MHSHHLNAHAFKGLGQHQGIFFCVTPTRAHFQSNGHTAGSASCHHRLCNFDGQSFVLHQGRARPFVANLFGRTAHVDVNDLGALIDVVGSGLSHHGGIGACNLDRNGAGFTIVVGTP